MLAKPKQNIARGVKEVAHKNGSKENACYSWDVTDEQAAAEGAAITDLDVLRPFTENFNSLVPTDKRRSNGRQTSRNKPSQY